MIRSYFVCSCGAKFFHVYDSYICPRCGRGVESTEKLPVPWLNRGEIQSMLSITDKERTICQICGEPELCFAAKFKDGLKGMFCQKCIDKLFDKRLQAHKATQEK